MATATRKPRKSKKEEIRIWNTYRVGLQFDGEFGGQIPRSEKEIRKMLEHRMPGRKPEGAVPIEELVEQVATETPVQDEESEDYVPGWSTFKRSTDGNLLYEGRCVRGHLKDCALQVAGFFPAIKAFRAKVVNSLYVVNKTMPLLGSSLNVISEIHDTEQRFIQVMTRQGPRSAIKYIDYILDPYLEFDIKLRADKVIEISHIESILEYGSLHGMGAERSQGWGRYTVERITER